MASELRELAREYDEARAALMSVRGADLAAFRTRAVALQLAVAQSLTLVAEVDALMSQRREGNLGVVGAPEALTALARQLVEAPVFIEHDRSDRVGTVTRATVVDNTLVAEVDVVGVDVRVFREMELGYTVRGAQHTAVEVSLMR